MGFSTVGVIFWLDSTSGNQDSEVAGKKWRSEQLARGEPEKIVDAPRSFDKKHRLPDRSEFGSRSDVSKQPRFAL
jgi:hypothetical protein